jgi:hypothetical protein
MAALKSLSSMPIIALGLVMLHGQAHAQAPGCLVMEAMVEDQKAPARNLPPLEDQEAYAHKMPTKVDKRGKEKTPKHLAQQGATEDSLVGSPPALQFSDGPHGSAGKDDAGTLSSAREKAFASGQSLSDYCNFKVETAEKR